MSEMGETERETAGLLRTVTFKEPSATLQFSVPSSDNLITKVFGTKNAPSQRVSESLDYEPVQNKIFYERMKAAKEKRHLATFGYTGHTLAKFIITMLTGIITGMFAVALSKSVGGMFAFKNEFVQHLLDQPGENRVWVAFFYHVLYSCCLVTIGVGLVQYWAPQAAGAGVTLVMAYLNGNHVPNLLRLRTLITKLLGTICSVSAGLPMGPEGPMVHIGACVASVITYAQCTCLRTGKWLACFGTRMKTKEEKVREKLKVLDDIVSDADHREFVSAGASAGISAAFGAPVGGVLFAMEEACSFWTRKTAWRCFIAAVCATFTMSEININAQHGMIAIVGVTNLENKEWIMQLPFVIINAGVAGLLGAAFNSMRMWLWRLRASKTRHVLRIAEVIGLAILCTVFAFFFASTAGKCMPKSADWGEEYGLKYMCEEEGHHNDLATLFLSSSHHTILAIFRISNTPGVPYVTHFSNGSLALFMCMYVVLMSIGAGTAIPGGLFMPSMIVGSVWGGLWGQLLRGWLPTWNVQPGLYALMAATGVLGGVFRSTISLVVLVIEGTRGMEFMTGVILSVVIANWVAHHIHHDGVYESELERIGNLYMLRDEPSHRLHTVTAEMVMATGVYGFNAIESVGHILEVLRTTTHNGFPVFGMPGAELASITEAEFDEETGAAPVGTASAISAAAPSATAAAVAIATATPATEKAATGGPGAQSTARLDGVILRSQLLVLLQRRHFCDAAGRPVGREADAKQEVELETEMRTFFRRYFTHNRYVSATATPLDALQLDGTGAASGSSSIDLRSLYLDLRPYMNRSPFTVRKDCSASRAHQAFVSLGLRHLVVVDALNHVVGIITRKDLDHAAGHGWWRMSAVAPKPQKGGPIQKLDSFFRKIPSVGFLQKLVNKSSSHGANDTSAHSSSSHTRHSSSGNGSSGHGTNGPHGSSGSSTPLAVGRDPHSNSHDGSEVALRLDSELEMGFGAVPLADEESGLAGPLGARRGGGGLL